MLKGKRFIKDDLNNELELNFCGLVHERLEEKEKRYQVKALVEFVDNKDFLFWLSSTERETIEDIEKAFTETMDIWTNNGNEEYLISQITHFENYDFSDKYSLECLVPKHVLAYEKY
jgi:chlorite dismutase